MPILRSTLFALLPVLAFPLLIPQKGKINGFCRGLSSQRHAVAPDHRDELLQNHQRLKRVDEMRRLSCRKILSLVGLSNSQLLANPSVVNAQIIKSRTEGYAVQKSDTEWKEQLSSMQYYVLREGGTERPGYSILEGEKREGIFECAACGTPLFESRYKFSSGTGWPSFARSLPGVEIEKVNPVQKTLSGAELRCSTCGGHLGDVFQDGYLFVGTEAQKSGQRFCIDGAALVFRSNSGETQRGDTKAKPKPAPSWLEPPAINPAS